MRNILKHARLILFLCLALAGSATIAGMRIWSDKEKLLIHPVSRLVPGAEAPNFALLDMEGRKVLLSDLQGKVVLVNFWATWCSSCMKKLPHIQQMYKDLKKEGLAVLTINMDKSPDVARHYISEYGYTFPVLLADEHVRSAYNVQAIPIVYLIDRHGQIQFFQTGSSPYKQEELITKIKQLLSEAT